MNTTPPTLLYRATCGKCRLISRLLVALSLGRLRRLPLASAEARTLCEEHQVPPGKLTLIANDEIYVGWPALRRILWPRLAR